METEDHFLILLSNLNVNPRDMIKRIELIRNRWPAACHEYSKSADCLEPDAIPEVEKGLELLRTQSSFLVAHLVTQIRCASLIRNAALILTCGTRPLPADSVAGLARSAWRVVEPDAEACPKVLHSDVADALSRPIFAQRSVTLAQQMLALAFEFAPDASERAAPAAWSQWKELLAIIAEKSPPPAKMSVVVPFAVFRKADERGRVCYFQFEVLDNTGGGTVYPAADQMLIQMDAAFRRIFTDVPERLRRHRFPEKNLPDIRVRVLDAQRQPLAIEEWLMDASATGAAARALNCLWAGRSPDFGVLVMAEVETSNEAGFSLGRVDYVTQKTQQIVHEVAASLAKYPRDPVPVSTIMVATPENKSEAENELARRKMSHQIGVRLLTC